MRSFFIFFFSILLLQAPFIHANDPCENSPPTTEQVEEDKPQPPPKKKLSWQKIGLMAGLCAVSIVTVILVSDHQSHHH